MKKILFVVCTHGDELAGFNLFVKYPYGMNEHVEWKVLIGNPEATMLNQRFFETNLNRAFDTPHATSYEHRRAEVLKKIFTEYDVVYDIHTTTAIRMNPSWDKCIFVNDVDKATIAECAYINPEYVIWDSDTTYQRQYLPAHARIGITVEYAKTHDAASDMKRIESDFLRIINQRKITRTQQNKRIYTEADCGVTQDQRDEYDLSFQEFVPLKAGDKKKLQLPVDNEYYPVFVNPRSVDATYYCFLNRMIQVTA